MLKVTIGHTQTLPRHAAVANGPFGRALPWLVIATVGAIAFYWDGLASLGVAWQRPEYSYGPMVPLITAYMTLREIHHRAPLANPGSSVPGLFVVIFGLLLGMVGNLAQIPDIVTYGFIFMVGGLILAVAGVREGIRFWPGWVHLFFMLPLPQFVFLHVSTQLQRISSIIGVGIVDAFGIPVFLDGNVIDLGIYKLQVAEACSGLNYLFPMFSFGWLMALLYNGPNWHRVVIFFAVIPITILMNSFRIGVIGVMVNQFGISYAEGFLHFFEGWVIFIACTLILYVVAWFLQRFLSFGGTYDGVVTVDTQGILTPLRKFPALATNRSLVAAALLIFAAGLAWQAIPGRATVAIDRQPLALFPMEIEGWKGRTARLEPDIARVLGADDYLVANYVSNTGQQIDLLMTYYKSQTEGSGIHSPQVCLPGGGWEVSQWRQKQLQIPGETPLGVNRAIIQKGLERQLVYYWFEMRGTTTTNDYVAKLLSLRDTIAKGRSDGGLVRLVTPIATSESIEAADQRLAKFFSLIRPSLPKYYPGS
jgi:exosortase D (VPLPA-CTERM-specific)